MTDKILWQLFDAKVIWSREILVSKKVYAMMDELIKNFYIDRTKSNPPTVVYREKEEKPNSSKDKIEDLEKYMALVGSKIDSLKVTPIDAPVNSIKHKKIQKWFQKVENDYFMLCSSIIKLNENL